MTSNETQIAIQRAGTAHANTTDSNIELLANAVLALARAVEAMEKRIGL
jgi:hypothetical protein